MIQSVDAAAVSWEELKQYVYEADGSWRDIYVLDATREDWKKCVDFVNANYRVAFNHQIEEHRDQIDFATVLEFWDSCEEALMPFSAVFVGEMIIKCHFFVDDEIENDVDPSEVDSCAAHLQLMAYMTGFSQALGKEVVLTGENYSPSNRSQHREWVPLLAVNNDQVQVYRYRSDASS